MKSVRKTAFGAVEAIVPQKEQLMHIRENRVLTLLVMAIIGAAVACAWMYLAAAAIAYGVSFTTLWNLAAYISCPVIKILGLNFWPVVLGNAFFYFACTWMVFAYIGKETAQLLELPRKPEE